MITSKSTRIEKNKLYTYRKKNKLCVQCGSKNLGNNILCEPHRKIACKKSLLYYRKKHPIVKRKFIEKHPFLTDEQFEMAKKFNMQILRLKK